MSITRVRYKETKQDTYKAVEVSTQNKKIKRFDSGDFVKDWYDATKYILTELPNELHHSNSSTVDHFIMDGDAYDSAYLEFDEVSEQPYLSYENAFDGIELFVKAGTKPTWNELRELCGD